MGRIARRVLLFAAGFVVLAFAIDTAVALFQPSFEPAECVLRTFDADGTAHEDRLALVDDGGTLWVQSGHHFRGWYHRLERNPDVELIRDGQARPYRAVPIDTPESEARIRSLMKQRVGTAGFYAIRTILLFADMKPVRLDPR